MLQDKNLVENYTKILYKHRAARKQYLLLSVSDLSGLNWS